MVTPALSELVIPVKMCELVVASKTGTLTCPGLGSCVAIVAYDPKNRVGGMAHVMLPKAFEDTDPRPARFGDKAVRALMMAMKEKGAVLDHLRLALVGGAQVLRLPSSSQMDIGSRNVESVQSCCRAEGLMVVDTDLGGFEGRTVLFSVGDGQVRVRKLSQQDRVLCSLSR